MLAGTRKGQRRKTARRAYMKTTPRRRRRTKKGMLSELFSSATSQASAKQVFSGAVGGASAMILDKVLSDNMSETQKGAYQILAGFLTASIFKKGYTGAGMSAVGITKILEENDLLNDDMFLSNAHYSNIDMSQPLMLEENHYLADMHLQENDPLNYNVGYFPAGFGGV